MTGQNVLPVPLDHLEKDNKNNADLTMLAVDGDALAEKLLGAQKLLTLITLPLDIIRDHGYETQFL